MSFLGFGYVRNRDREIQELKTRVEWYKDELAWLASHSRDLKAAVDALSHHDQNVVSMALAKIKKTYPKDFTCGY
jgi:hypothetical protein